MISTKPLVLLEAWQVWRAGAGRCVLWGLASAHPRHPGVRLPMRTSLIVRFDPEASIAESLNTFYCLGPRLDALREDEHGNPMYVSLRGLSARREAGTRCWVLASGEQVLETLESDDVIAVIVRLLDIVLPARGGADAIVTATRH